MLIEFKTYIYSCKRKGVLPKVAGFKNYIKSKLDVYNKIAFTEKERTYLEYTNKLLI